MQWIKRFTTLLTLLMLCFSTASYALPSDSEQPIRVQADSADLDNNKGILVYRGNVIITQGTMKVMGHTVTIVRNKDGNVEVMTSQGNPAYYEQQPAVNDPVMKAYGKTIQYQVTNEKIILNGNAKVIQKNNVFTGTKIVYDTKKKLINAIGGVKGEGGRIDMTIEPEKNKK